MAYYVTFEPKERSRFVILLDHGYTGFFEIIDDAIPIVAAYMASKNAAVVIWLPEGAGAVVDVVKITEGGSDNPAFSFSYSVFHAVGRVDQTLSAALADKDSKVEIKFPVTLLSKAIAGAKEAEALDPPMRQWRIECPLDSGSYTIKSCPMNLIPTCNEATGEVTCGGGGPG